MKQPNRIIQLNKEIRANAATIVIAAVLLYVVISVVSSLSKESVTIYQVSKGDVSNEYRHMSAFEGWYSFLWKLQNAS